MKHPLTVLVIDDDAAFTNLIQFDLSSTGNYTVRTANSGEDGIELLLSDPIDLVLLDYNLGTMNGLQILEWMSKQKIDIPVIMLTSAGTEEVAVNAMKLGAYDYARKERLELDHLPILINGVYERFIFRKEARERELEKLEEEKQKAAVQMFQTTVRSIAHHVNNALAVIMLRTSAHEQHARQHLEPGTADEIIALINDLRGQASVIEAVVRSLVELSNAVYTQYVSDQAIIDIRKELESNLLQLQEQQTKTH
jgi:DNA-binding response OmpR family regulator